MNNSEDQTQYLLNFGANKSYVELYNIEDNINNQYLKELETNNNLFNQKIKNLNNYLINSDVLRKQEFDLAHYDARSQFELGKRFGEMILSKCY